jgi:adenylate cyclase
VAKERVKRRLAAILAADVVGYSRLMGTDEAGTRARFNDHLNELIQPSIADRQGRIVKTLGDGLLVEFASVVDAVQCAVEIQNNMVARNADEPVEQRMDFRIGVNLGDVIIEGDDIHGDGVNVAARLEALADPGGICISGDVHRQCRGKVEVTFEDLGEQEVKNIQEPVQAFRVVMAPSAPDEAIAVPQLTDKPSIAVLPFANMSGDPDQEYFSDGITEDIITALSRWRTIPVIARNSTFVYKGQSVDIRKVGEELGVRYVLEGSVQKAGTRIRITAQLIEAGTNHHVWAEQYDRDLEDIFALQDEIVQRIAAIIEPTIRKTEHQKNVVTPTNNLTAWDYCLRGYEQIYVGTKEANVNARDMFSRAIELDPYYARAHTGICYTLGRDLRFRWCANPKDWLERLFASARRAIELDGLDAEARTMLVRAYHVDGNHEAALIEAKRAIELNPNDAYICNVMGTALSLAGGRYQEGIPWFEKSLELNPLDPQKHQFLTNLALARLCAGQHADALEMAEEATRTAPGYFEARVALASAYGYLGRSDDAIETLEGFHEDAQSHVEQEPRWIDETKGYVLEGLRKAGILG